MNAGVRLSLAATNGSASRRAADDDDALPLVAANEESRPSRWIPVKIAPRPANPARTPPAAGSALNRPARRRVRPRRP